MSDPDKSSAPSSALQNGRDVDECVSPAGGDVSLSFPPSGVASVPVTVI